MESMTASAAQIPGQTAQAWATAQPATVPAGADGQTPLAVISAAPTCLQLKRSAPNF